MVTVSIMHHGSEKCLTTFKDLPIDTSISEIKEKLFAYDRNKYKINRCSLRLQPKGKSLTDKYALSEMPNASTTNVLHLYFKDLGPQVGWSTVFFVEYGGPPLLYLLIWWLRQPTTTISWLKLTPMRDNVGLRQLALGCYLGHFVKRLLETKFVHRFSHATMPLRNIFKNCSYYWGFALVISYFTNHPLYSPPSFGMDQVYAGLCIFIFGELGNLSTHLAFKNMRPAGSIVRRIPEPVPGSPFTQLFRFVVCPNYTYETIAWIGFAVMTQTLPATLFALFGFGQMTVWALAKLRAYRKEFTNFPKGKKAIVPFVL